MRFALRLVCLPLAMLGTGSFAFGEGNTLSPAEMDSATVIESVSIPMPGEFFAAINKLERPNWAQLSRQTPPVTTASRAQSALNLGTRVSDGFIAVEAQDGQQVKNVGKDIIDLAKSLGVSQSILARGNSISDFAENNEWSALKEELEATQNEVKLQMAEQKDDDLITLVTVGAWVRGMQAASKMIGETYSADSAALLRQPAIASYLVSRIDGLGDRAKNEPVVEKVRDGLTQIASVTTNNKVPTADDVNQIQQITTGLVDTICGPVPTPAPAAQ